MRLSCAVRSFRLAGNPDLADNHISSCLRCQVEAVRYRTLARSLAALRIHHLDAPPGFSSVVRSGLADDGSVPNKTSGMEAAVAAAGLVAVALAVWRRSLSA